MKVKVLQYFDYDNGSLMDTFVFKEEANIYEIQENVNKIFWESDGGGSYYDIIMEHYKHLLIEVVDNEKVDW